MVKKPKCSEEGMVDLLSWYVTKSLSETEMVKVEQHLAGCSFCTEELNRIQWISEGLYSSTGDKALKHVNSRLLTIYSESKKELKKEVIQRIEDHVSECRQCSEELEILNKVNQSLDGSGAEPFFEGIIQKIQAFFAKPILKPAYVYILILALIYPAWLGLFKRDNGQGKIVVPININSLFVLEQDDQRAAGEQLNKIVLEHPSDFFAFSFVLPVKNQEDNIYQTTISNEENKAVWRNENMKFIDQFGTLILICPKKYFKEGKYSLSVIEKQKQTKKVINKYMFNFEVITK